MSSNFLALSSEDTARPVPIGYPGPEQHISKFPFHLVQVARGDPAYFDVLEFGRLVEEHTPNHDTPEIPSAVSSLAGSDDDQPGDGHANVEGEDADMDVGEIYQPMDTIESSTQQEEVEFEADTQTQDDQDIAVQNRAPSKAYLHFLDYFEGNMTRLQNLHGQHIIHAILLSQLFAIYGHEPQEICQPLIDMMHAAKYFDLNSHLQRLLPYGQDPSYTYYAAVWAMSDQNATRAKQVRKVLQGFGGAEDVEALDQYKEVTQSWRKKAKEMEMRSRGGLNGFQAVHLRKWLLEDQMSPILKGLTQAIETHLKSCSLLHIAVRGLDNIESFGMNNIKEMAALIDADAEALDAFCTQVEQGLASFVGVEHPMVFKSLIILAIYQWILSNPTIAPNAEMLQFLGNTITCWKDFHAQGHSIPSEIWLNSEPPPESEDPFYLFVLGCFVTCRVYPNEVTPDWIGEVIADFHHGDEGARAADLVRDQNQLDMSTISQRRIDFARECLVRGLKHWLQSKREERALLFDIVTRNAFRRST